MKKKKFILVMIVVLLLGIIGSYFVPKRFGSNLSPSDVDHINVLDGNTGVAFTITNSEDIEYIVTNIQSISMKRNGLSLGKMGYSFKISYVNSNDKEVAPVFILNSDKSIRKDPFLYTCDGGLCFDFLKKCEDRYRTNITESVEEK